MEENPIENEKKSAHGMLVPVLFVTGAIVLLIIIKLII